MTAETPGLAGEGLPQFSVAQFFADGTHEYVGRWLDAKAACTMAVRYATSVGAKIGTTRQVIITDSLDFTVWDWRFGEGMVFPPSWVGVDLYD